MSATLVTKPVPLDSGCLELGGELERRITSLWAVLRRESGGQVSSTGAAVLAALRDRGALRVTELAAEEGVSQPTMTMLLKRLERDGLVERHSDPRDGRASRFTVTEPGLQLLASRARSRAEALGRRLARISESDRAILDGAIAAIEAVLGVSAHELRA
jgi:DNA-binding MarR family transcriptional regulator